MEQTDLSVALVGPLDREDQARLFGRCFAKPARVEALRWRYDDNPQGQAVSLVLRGPDEAAVCSYAYVPRLAVARGAEDQRVTGVIGQQGDVMTDPDWQRKGLARRLVDHCASETRAAGFVLNWGFPNRQSAPVFLKFDWKSVGVIRPKRFLMKADGIARKRRLADGRLAQLRVGFDARACRKARERLGALPDGLELRPIQRFAEHEADLAKIQADLEARFGFVLLRDGAFLDWRFVDTPSKVHRVFGAFRGAELLGYVVVQPPSTWGPEGVGFLVDLAARGDGGFDADVLTDALVGAGLDALAEASVVEAWSVDGSYWQARLERAGFRAAKPENHLFVYHFVLDPEHPLAGAPALADASSWYLTDGDRDDELMG